MERITNIMEKLRNRTGLALGSKNETDEERLERERKNCQFRCDSENRIKGELDNVDGIHCEKCNDKGYYSYPKLYANNYYDTQCTCECWKKRRPIRTMLRSGLKDVMNDCTFEKYIVTENWQSTVLNTAKRYISDGSGKWFFFGGATGAGKTHICTAIALELLRNGAEVKYMLWKDEAAKLKARVNDPEYADLINQYKAVDVLYIDDLFKTGKNEHQAIQRPTAGDINLAFEIINSRYAQNKITIISSECTIGDLIDIDEAIAGRIKQRSGEYCLSINPDINKNYRLRG